MSCCKSKKRCAERLSLAPGRLAAGGASGRDGFDEVGAADRELSWDGEGVFENSAQDGRAKGRARGDTSPGRGARLFIAVSVRFVCSRFYGAGEATLNDADALRRLDRGVRSPKYPTTIPRTV